MSYVYTSENGLAELIPIRLQDPDTHREELKIDIKMNQTDSGTIYCNMLTLEADLQQLRLYGTGIQRYEIVKIRKEIDEHYLDIKTQSLDNEKSMSKEIAALFNVFCGNIDENKSTYITEDIYYDMPVATFNTLISESEYPDFSSTKCKQRLKQLKYIKCNNNRNDYTRRNTTEDKKTEKVIRFNIQPVDDRLVEMEKNNI